MSELFSILRRLWNHPANASRLAATARFARWQLAKRMGRSALPFSYHGFTVPGFLDSHSASAAYYFNGLPDHREMLFLTHLLRPGDRFLDIGANIGLYTLLAASVIGPEGHIDAFEPNPATRKRLEETIRLNGLSDQVTIHSEAASDSEGTVDFGFADDDCQTRLKAPTDAGTGAQTVPTIRLDEKLGRNSYALLKMDIEGGEPLALAGASGMLAEGNPPAMLIEMAGYSRRFGVSTSQLIQSLADQGYRCGIYEPQQRVVRYTDTPWQEGLENVVAVSEIRKSEVEERLSEHVSPVSGTGSRT